MKQDMIDSQETGKEICFISIYIELQEVMFVSALSLLQFWGSFLTTLTKKGSIIWCDNYGGQNENSAPFIVVFLVAHGLLESIL